MTKNIITLDQLTGLTEQDLADVLASNPRAYMTVKGAVAEKHLEKLLDQYKKLKIIKGFRNAGADSDKDFYVTLPNEKEITLECKNVQVLNTSQKKYFASYIQFLVSNNYLEENWIIETLKRISQQGLILENFEAFDSFEDVMSKILSSKVSTLSSIMRFFPQTLRESGVPRYQFSASLIKIDKVNKIPSYDFLSQFDEVPLTIDFQRTRNSTDSDGDTKRKRFYETSEIDVVAACLFSRTMKWEFVFGHSKSFQHHSKYKGRFAKKLVIDPQTWKYDLASLL